MIEVQSLVKKFDGIEVLKGITSSFNSREVSFIIGRSGSGKTVFMQCLLGLIRYDSGQVLFDGEQHDFQSMDTKVKEFRNRIGVVFQYSALFDWLNVSENIRFPLDNLTDLTSAEKKDKVEEALLQVGLQEAWKKLPVEISGGMKKRVAIARALIMNPKYLFADEPNSGLDPYTSSQIDELFKKLTLEHNTTTIINSHDINSVISIGDKASFLHRGEKEWEGPVRELKQGALTPALEEFMLSSEIIKSYRSL